MASIRELFRSSPRLSTRQELQRLCSLPRRSPTTTHVLGPSIQLADGPSFAAQYEELYLRDSLRFVDSHSAQYIVDCGANVGTSVIRLRQIAPTAQIVAFEPDPYLFDLLNQNVATVVGLANIELVRAAVWPHRAERVIFQPDEADAGRVVAEGGPRAARRIEVPAVFLGDYLQRPVDLLKMDIEGAELAVLASCREQLTCIHRLFVEYHSEAASPQAFDHLLRLLSDAGFRYQIEGARISLQPFMAPGIADGFDARADVFAWRPAQSRTSLLP